MQNVKSSADSLQSTPVTLVVSADDEATPVFEGVTENANAIQQPNDLVVSAQDQASPIFEEVDCR